MVAILPSAFASSCRAGSRCLLGALGWLLAAATVDAQVTAFRDVTVIPMDAPRVLREQTVLIEGGRIVALGDSARVSVPRGAHEIDGEGRYLMPGLADMHAHISGYADDSEAGQNPAIARNQLLLYAATGVTLLRDAAGSPAHFDYLRKLRSGEWIGPDMFVASPIFEGERNVWDFTVKVTDPADVAPLVADYADAGYWGLKVYHTVSPEVYDAIIAAARQHGLPVMGHVPFDVGIDATLESGLGSVEHLRGYDFDRVPVDSLWADGGRSRERFSSWNRMTAERRDELVHKTVAEGVWNSPTLAVNRMLFDPASREAVTSHPRFQRVHPALRGQMLESNALDEIFPEDSRVALREAFPVMLDFIEALQEAGAGLLIGTDAIVPGYVPGYTPVDEIASFVEAGLSPFEALEAATTGPARYLGIDGDRGTVAVGKRADLILLAANPLEDVSALWELEGVVLAGQWHTLQDLEQALDTSLGEIGE